MLWGLACTGFTTFIAHIALPQYNSRRTDPPHQVYNDRVYDLLSREDSNQPLPVLDAAKGPVATDALTIPHSEPSAGGGGVKLEENNNNDSSGLAPFSHGESRVVGLSVHRVDRPEAVLQLLRRGDRNRRVSSTIVSFVSDSMVFLFLVQRA